MQYGKLINLKWAEIEEEEEKKLILLCCFLASQKVI